MILSDIHHILFELEKFCSQQNFLCSQETSASLVSIFCICQSPTPHLTAAPSSPNHLMVSQVQFNCPKTSNFLYYEGFAEQFLFVIGDCLFLQTVVCFTCFWEMGKWAQLWAQQHMPWPPKVTQTESRNWHVWLLVMAQQIQGTRGKGLGLNESGFGVRHPV